MEAKLRALAAHLLERAADEFANHGCNDFDLHAFGFTPEEADKLHFLMAANNGTPEDASRGKWAMDWYLMSFLARQLKAGLL